MAKNRNQDRGRNDRNKGQSNLQQTSSNRGNLQDLQNEDIRGNERSNQQVNQTGKKGSRGGNR